MTFTYSGNELALFNLAHHWKQYWSTCICPYIHGQVVEVGAGNGNNTLRLQAICTYAHWWCVEPDRVLLAQLAMQLEAQGEAARVTVLTGTLPDLPATPTYQTVLYLDVLEHIAADRAELQQAAQRLTTGGHLIVLAPAHQWLYTPFDEQIGHYRRYTRQTLNALTPSHCQVVLTRYLDTVGLLASLLNRLIMRQRLPTASQIRLWDNVLIPLSRRVDPLLGWHIGKSILLIWRKTS
jgi:hypothetical protein